MMEEKQTVLTPSALCLGTVTAAVGECLLRAAGQPNARAACLLGAAQALALMALGALFAVVLERRPRLQRCACAVLCVWFAWELALTVWQAQSLCRAQFATSTVLGAVPLLVWLGWGRTARQLNDSARVFWWFALCGALVCAAGLGGQLRWQRLYEQTSFAAPDVSVYAEYFAAPLLCARRSQRRALCLPLGAFAVRAGFALEWGLLFGAADGYAGAELARALAWGAFSRLDAFALLIWLTLALYRVCFLCAVVCLLWKRLLPRAEESPC